MRFLQTEWHRHERDRNAWEIDRQEMKSRIANLEGQARRADATQKALKKYVTILEKKVKDQAVALKANKVAEVESEKSKPDRAALLLEKLRREYLLAPHRASLETMGPTHRGVKLTATSFHRETRHSHRARSSSRRRRRVCPQRTEVIS